MSQFTPRLLAALVCGGAMISGCTTGPVYTSGEQAPSEKALPKAEYMAAIRVESIVKGGGVKLNGFVVASLPGVVNVETDEAGKVTKQYVITLSTNVLDQDTGRVTLEPGEGAPGRIYFDLTRVQVAGQALVEKTR